MYACFTGKYGLYKLFTTEKHEAAFFQLLDAGSLMWRKSMTMHEAMELKCIVVQALHNFEQNFPVSEMDVKLHNWIHLAEKLALVGPFQCTYMFPYERSYKILREWMTNKRYPESTILKTAVRFNHSLAWMAEQHYKLMSCNVDGAPLLMQMAEHKHARKLFEFERPTADGGEVTVAIPSYERCG